MNTDEIWQRLGLAESDAAHRAGHGFSGVVEGGDLEFEEDADGLGGEVRRVSMLGGEFNGSL